MAAPVIKNLYKKLVGHYSTLYDDPALFISVQEKNTDVLKRLTKIIYDFTKEKERIEHQKRKTVNTADDSDGEGGETNTGRKYYHPKALPELIIDGFDLEQVWQELELQNKYVLKSLKKRVSQINENTQALSGNVFTDRNAEEQSRGDEEEWESQSEDDEEMRRIIERDDVSGDSDFDFGEDEQSSQAAEEEDEEQEGEENDDQKASETFRPSQVDDQFFKLSQLEQFLTQEDRKEELARDEGLTVNREDPEDEQIDYFEDLPTSEDEVDDDDDDLEEGKRKGARFWTFEDFFDPPMEDNRSKYTRLGTEENDIKRSKIMDPGEVDSTKEQQENVEPPKNVGKSGHEKRQEKLKRITQDHEEQNLTLKPWQMFGEIAANQRPENSLLQEDLDFNHIARPPPTITEEVTVTVEGFIKQRIKDTAFDDVERKIKPVDEPYEYKKNIVLDQEKSKLSLAEIYEQEYLKQQQTEKIEEETPEHKSIRELMSTLFTKLDVLFSFHFTPRAPAPEIKVVNKLPAISVEDVVPIAISNANLVAPEEIKAKSRGELKGTTERTKTDKRRDRVQSKRAKKRKAQMRAERDKIREQTDRRKRRLHKKVDKGDGKKQNTEEEKGKKTKMGSSSFFTKLQDEVKKTKETIQDKKKGIKRKGRNDPKDFDAKKFKL